MAHMDNTIKQTITWQRACHAQVFPGCDTSCFLKKKKKNLFENEIRADCCVDGNRGLTTGNHVGNEVLQMNNNHHSIPVCD